MLRRLLRSAALIVAAFSFLPSATSHAQEDWATNDSSFEARKIERYKQLVDQSPEKSYAFTQLMATVGKGAAYQSLLAEYRKKADAKPGNFNLRMVLGHMYQYGGRTNEALAEYRKALDIKKTPLVYIAIGAAEAENRNYDPAVAAYEAAAELKPSREQRQEIWRALAEIALYRRDLDRAKKCFAELIQIEPNSLFVRRELAQIYEQNRMYAEARDVLQDAVKIASANEKDQLALDIAGLYESEGNDDEALKRYEALSAKLAGSHWMQRELNARIIDIYRRKGDVRELAARFEKQWKSPTYQQRLELADLFVDAGDPTKALDHLKKAVASSPKSPEAYERLIRFYKSQGQLDAMYETRRTLIKQFPGNPDYRFALYEDYQAERQLDKAFAVLEETQKKFPSDFEVLRRIAEEWRIHGRGQKAQAIYESWLKKHPSELDAIEALGDYYDTDGQRKKAVETWRKIENLSIDKPTKLETLARIYAEHGYTDEAEELYRNYVALSPKDCLVLSQYADILTTNGKIDQSADAWEKLALTCPNDATVANASRQIARIYESRGMKQKAMSQFRGKCEANPHDPARFVLFAAVARAFSVPAEAIPTLEGRDPDDRGSADVLRALHTLYAEAGDLDMARQTLQKLGAISEGERRESLIEMAALDVTSGDLEAAQEHLQEALRLNANDAETHEKLADVQIRRRFYEEAANNYETAFQIDDHNWQVAFKHATTLSILGKTKEADDLYVRIVRESTDESLSLRAAQRAIDDHAWLGTLDALAKELLPLLRSPKRHALYMDILLSVAQAQAQPLVLKLTTQDARHSAAARLALRDLGEQYAGLLVEATLFPEASISGRAIRLSEWLMSPTLLHVIGKKIASAPITDAGRLEQLVMVRAIAHSPLPGAVSILKPFLAGHYARALREHAAWALGLIPSAEAAAALRELTTSPLDSLRALAVVGLGRQNAHLDEIHKVLKDDPSAYVRDAAAWMLAARQYDRAYPDIRKLLRDNAKTPHQFWALQRANAENAVETILDAVWCGTPQSRQTAAGLMHTDANVDAIAQLSLVEAQGRFIHATATQYLGSLDVPMLLDHFSEISTDGAANATPARWLRENRAAFVENVKRIATQKPQCRAQMLDDLVTPENAPHLNAADISQYTILVEAVRAIQPNLANWAQSTTDDASRRLAARSLRALALTKDADALAMATEIAQNHTDMGLRLDAIDAIAHFDTTEASEALRKLAEDKSYLIRAQAVSRLNPTDPKDQKVIQKASEDSYALVAETAARLLAIARQ